MKKENRKLAQQRRAQERAKAEKMAKWEKIRPLVIVLAGIAVIIAAVFAAGKLGKKEEASMSSSGKESSMASTEAEKTGSEEISAANVFADKETADGYKKFDASALKGCYDISKDELIYVQIKVKDYGTITAALDATIAPLTVSNFTALAEDGFYNGLTFHRIIKGFMMQGGDPNGNGTGGSSETIKGEFTENDVKNPITHVRGAISMARSGDPDSASSQFFIVQADSNYLDGKYAGFGYVTDGMDIVDRICSDAKPTDSNGTIAKEKQPVIESITVIS